MGAPCHLNSWRPQPVYSWGTSSPLCTPTKWPSICFLGTFGAVTLPSRGSPSCQQGAPPLRSWAPCGICGRTAFVPLKQPCAQAPAGSCYSADRGGAGLGPGCISNKLPGDFEAAGLWTPLGVAKVFYICSVFTVMSGKGPCVRHQLALSLCGRPRLWGGSPTQNPRVCLLQTPAALSPWAHYPRVSQRPPHSRAVPDAGISTTLPFTPDAPASPSVGATPPLLLRTGMVLRSAILQRLPVAASLVLLQSSRGWQDERVFMTF